MSCIALIPARAGSKRVKLKNIRILKGHPLIAYTIAAAIQSGIFTRVIVSTDSKEIADVARKYGAEVPFMRPKRYAGDRSPDIQWIKFTLEELKHREILPDCFAILRPTSPFRKPETIIRAWKTFCNSGGADSLRAVEKCRQHPAKMWRVKGNRMEPLMPGKNKNVPWHSSPYQSLPLIYAQNASLEIAFCKIPLKNGSIAGKKIMPFLTEGYEGFDINLPEDWALAELFVSKDPDILPKLN